jgi:hypothetical protein
VSSTDYLRLVLGIMPAAFLCDLAVVGLVALWWYVKRRRA